MNDSSAAQSDAGSADVLEAMDAMLQEALCCEKEEQLAATCLFLVLGLTGSRLAVLGELNDEGRFDLLASSGPGEEAPESRTLQARALLESVEANGLWERAMKSDRPVMLDRRDPASVRSAAPSADQEPGCVLGVALRQDGAPFGILAVADRPAGFGPADGERLRLLSVGVAKGLAGFRAQRRLREAYEQLQAKLEEQTAELFSLEKSLQTEIAAREQAEVALQETEELRGAFIEAVLTMQDEERNQLARELHDEMGSKLTSISIGLRSLDQVDSVQAARKELGKVQKLVDGIMRDVSRLARGLYPLSLEQLGLHAALRQYVDEFSRIHSLKVHVHAENLDDELSASAAKAIYRMVQEALTNVAKHAEARNVSVVLGKKGSEIRVFVEDDGQGLPESTARSEGRRVTGIGLHGIRERASLLGGTMEIESKRGEGTALLVRIPAPRGEHG